MDEIMASAYTYASQHKTLAILVIPGLIGILGTLLGIIVTEIFGIIRRKQERKFRKEEMFYESRTKVYGKLLALLRSLVDEDEKEFKFVASESLLYAENELRDQILKAIRSLDDNKWEEIFGKSKGAAIASIEKLMKKELGIKFRFREENIWNKLKNWTKKVFLGKTETTQTG